MSPPLRDHSVPVVFRRILDETLAVLNDAIETGEFIPPDVSAAVDAFRAWIAGSLGAVELDPLATIVSTAIDPFVPAQMPTAPAWSRSLRPLLITALRGHKCRT